MWTTCAGCRATLQVSGDGQGGRPPATWTPPDPSEERDGRARVHSAPVGVSFRGGGDGQDPLARFLSAFPGLSHRPEGQVVRENPGEVTDADHDVVLLGAVNTEGAV